ncbi:MAG: hypothetical protein QOE72_1328 [Chloroflexota bacterium]|jgi:hypothetical protein|nr:hypothetical protein [Chloroflexota bacterium]
MHTGKSKLLRAIAAEERRQERDEKRATRRRLRAERRAHRPEPPRPAEQRYDV